MKLPKKWKKAWPLLLLVLAGVGWFVWDRWFRPASDHYQVKPPPANANFTLDDKGRQGYWDSDGTFYLWPAPKAGA